MEQSSETTLKRSAADYIRIAGIGIIVIIAVTILAKAFINRNKAQELISVTGIGSINFEADLIVSSGDFKRMDMSLQNAYKMLNDDKKIIEDFLRKKGVNDKEITFSAISINKEYNQVTENNQIRSYFAGYQLTQNVRIESKDVDKIEAIDRQISEIINRGVEFYSGSPSYYYTKIEEMKLAVIAAATKNARLRAESIAENADGKLGELKNATMGVFQITAQNSDEGVSWSGNFNTGSKKKTATTTMRLQYSID